MKTAIRVIIDLICLAVVAIPAVVLEILQPSFKRGVFVDDDSLKYPNKTEIFSDELLYVTAFCLPPFVIAVIEGFHAYRRNGASTDSDTIKSRPVIKWLWSTYNACIYYFFGAALERLATNIAKTIVSRPRPYYFDVCKPKWPQINTTGFIEGYICEETDDRLLRDSRLSFPSGHASLSAYAMVYLIFFVQVKVQLEFCHFLKPVCQMVFFLLTLFISLSRVSDYSHHMSDVLVGAAFGVVVAFINVSYISDLYKRRRNNSGVYPTAYNRNRNYETFEENCSV